jgi:multidrug efflux pump subunit AcrA (membrane-fusion protein)
MSDTPRTDAEFKLEAFFDGSGIVETVLVEFARQLETELAEARAEIENLQWHVSEEQAKTGAALELNDRALELVNEARADAKHWKSECNALQRMAHEARAEIERLQAELKEIANSCAETQLDADWCKACTSRKWCAAGQSLIEAAERGE